MMPTARSIIYFLELPVVFHTLLELIGKEKKNVFLWKKVVKGTILKI